MTDVHGSAKDCYVKQVLDDGHFEPLGVPTERYEARENLE